MNEAEAKQYGEAHAAAVRSGDFKRLGDDIDPSAREAVGALAPHLPAPVTGTEVQVREVTADRAVIRITYVGDSKSTTLESTWKPSGDRYRIFEATLVAE